jgi:hypothetical protein
LLNDLFATGKITNPLTGMTMAFRRESLGLVGKNHRYVWLADKVTMEQAIKMLG